VCNRVIDVITREIGKSFKNVKIKKILPGFGVVAFQFPNESMDLKNVSLPEL
jgi:hypothetical protein